MKLFYLYYYYINPTQTNTNLVAFMLFNNLIQNDNYNDNGNVNVKTRVTNKNIIMQCRSECADNIIINLAEIDRIEHLIYVNNQKTCDNILLLINARRIYVQHFNKYNEYTLIIENYERNIAVANNAIIFA